MCVAIAKPAGIDLPDEGKLDACEWSNRDGCGIAWADESEHVHIKKDFASNNAMKAWIKGNITPAMAMLIHYRQATSGGVSVGLRHPFPIDDRHEYLTAHEINTDMALIHNGVIWSLSDSKGNKLSDTALFIQTILADPNIKANIRTNEAIQTLISGMIGSSNKLALLWPDGYILTFGKFYEDEGVSYSNEQFKPISYYQPEEFGFGHNLGRGKRNKRGNYPKLLDYKGAKDMEYCACCYQEFPRHRMYRDSRPDMPKDNMICELCHMRVKNSILLPCDICQDFFEQNDLVDVKDSTDGGNTIVDSHVCAECYAAYRL